MNVAEQYLTEIKVFFKEKADTLEEMREYGRIQVSEKPYYRIS